MKMKALHTTCGAEIPLNVAHVKNHLDRKCTWKSTIKEIFSSLHWLSLETGWLTQLTAWSCWSRTHPLRPGSELWMPLPVSLNWTRKIRWFYTHSISSLLFVILFNPESGAFVFDGVLVPPGALSNGEDGGHRQATLHWPQACRLSSASGHLPLQLN